EEGVDALVLDGFFLDDTGEGRHRLFQISQAQGKNRVRKLIDDVLAAQRVTATRGRLERLRLGARAVQKLEDGVIRDVTEKLERAFQVAALDRVLHCAAGERGIVHRAQLFAYELLHAVALFRELVLYRLQQVGGMEELAAFDGGIDGL